MDLYFKDTKENIDEVCNTLNEFCNNTGFKINYEKTTLYQIGKNNESIAQIYTRGMKVVTDKINVLGVWISTNKNDLCNLNYNEIILKTRAILQHWTQRQLSLYGKIIVINSLVASQFVYKMMVLPQMTENLVKQLHKICEEFIWNGRKPKIKLQN